MEDNFNFISIIPFCFIDYKDGHISNRLLSAKWEVRQSLMGRRRNLTALQYQESSYHVHRTPCGETLTTPATFHQFTSSETPYTPLACIHKHRRESGICFYLHITQWHTRWNTRWHTEWHTRYKYRLKCELCLACVVSQGKKELVETF